MDKVHPRVLHAGIIGSGISKKDIVPLREYASTLGLPADGEVLSFGLACIIVCSAVERAASNKLHLRGIHGGIIDSSM